MVIKVYGIKNCDTVKRARTWLESHDVEYEFHDFKTEGVTQTQLERWAGSVGWERLLNRAGMTFRKLPDRKKNVPDQAAAFALMLAQPSIIKRPVLQAGKQVLVGFDETEYRKLIS